MKAATWEANNSTSVDWSPRRYFVTWWHKWITVISGIRVEILPPLTSDCTADTTPHGNIAPNSTKKWTLSEQKYDSTMWSRNMTKVQCFDLASKLSTSQSIRWNLHPDRSELSQHTKDNIRQVFLILISWSSGHFCQYVCFLLSSRKSPKMSYCKSISNNIAISFPMFKAIWKGHIWVKHPPLRV